MPELCRFYNIVIKMLYNDDSQHHKPHFHVYYNKYEASVGIEPAAQAAQAGAGVGGHTRG